MQRRAGQMQAGEQLQTNGFQMGHAFSPDTLSAEPQQDSDASMNLRGEVNIKAMQDLGVLILKGNEADVEKLQSVIQQTEQAAGASSRTATPTGLLSLKFDIPTDGQQIDFLRVGGNPALSLDVRSSESVTKGTGLIWLIFCVIGILLLIGPGRNGKPLIFCQRLFLMIAIAGLAAWILTSSDLRGFGLMVCLPGSVAFAVTTTIACQRNLTRRAMLATGTGKSN